MPLESTMICVDNSEWMRNGDYVPTRLDSQQDAANLLVGAKIQQNPESTVGFLTMAGNGVEVLASPTDDMGKLLGCLQNLKIGQKINLANAVRVAHLALKHRKNKNGSQRIVVFVGSPVDNPLPVLVKAAKVLRKADIAVDVVSMGEVEENQEKLQTFVDEVNKNSNSHLVTIPPGVLPADVLISSPVVHGGDGEGSHFAAPGGFGTGGGGGGNTDEFGVDPNMDPDLAMVLRISMEEERARQQAQEASNGGVETGESKAMDVDPVPTGTAQPTTTGVGNDFDDELAMAMRMSMEEERARTEETTAPTSEVKPMDEDDEEAVMRKALEMSMGDNMDEEDETARAIRLSMEGEESTAPAPAPAPVSAPAPAPASMSTFQNADFVRNMLANVQGVDPNHPSIQAALEQIAKSDEEKKDDSKDKK